jgi:hypothetical protein
MKGRLILAALVVIAAVLAIAGRGAPIEAAAATKPARKPLVLVDFSDASSVKLSPDEAKALRVDSDGGQAIQITTDAKAQWPSVVIEPKDGKWDFSGFDAATADIQNPEDSPVRVLMNVN